MINPLLLQAALFTCALAAPGAVQENTAAVGNNTLVPVLLALKQNNIDKMMDYVMEVSDPTSPKYGQHYTRDQVDALFAPPDAAIADVRAWLVSTGVPTDAIIVSQDKTWMRFTSSAGHVDSIFSANLTQSSNGKPGMKRDGSSAPPSAALGPADTPLPVMLKVPPHLAGVLEFVVPSLNSSRSGNATLPSNRRRTKVRPFTGFVNPVSTDDCDKTVTPACIRAMYQVPASPADLGTKCPKQQGGNVLGIFETEDNFYNQADMNEFLAIAAQNITDFPTPQNQYMINGAQLSTDRAAAGTEANLDFQMATPLIYPQKTALYQIKYPKYGLEDFNYIFAQFQSALAGSFCTDNQDQGQYIDCNRYPAPAVLSVSWGSPEPSNLAFFFNEDLNTIYTRLCNEWGKLALQGTTVIAASGDTGVDGNGNSCKETDAFLVDATSACPYITAVGSTLLPPGSRVDEAQVATVSFSSGGGFSNLFSTPPWQKNAVSSYLTNHDPLLPYGTFNKHGRAYPDVAAVGDNGFVVSQGTQHRVSGTSMSAPIFAGLISLINEDRLRAGKSTVGFINPAIYKAYDSGAALFTDVTVGSNPGNCHKRGFQAAPGWDPVTGLGTPIYPKLRDYFMEL